MELIDKNRFWLQLCDSLSDDFGLFNRQHQTSTSTFLDESNVSRVSTSVLREQSERDQAHSAWVLWDRSTWVHEVERMGLIEGREARSRV